MQLASILDQYHDALQAKYGSQLLPGHLRGKRPMFPSGACFKIG